MTSLYSRKLWRELARERGQALAISVVTGIGVMLFVVSAGAYRDLRNSYAATRERLALATLHVEAARIGSADVAAVRALPQVSAAEVRLQTEVPALAGSDRVALRVLSLPDGAGQPALDRLLVVAGALPARDGEVVLEKHFATFHHLGPGATLELGANAGAVTVSGVAVSAEYLWVARDANDFMPSPAEFGVAWMRRSPLRALAATLLQRGGAELASASLSVAASEAPGNEVLISLVPGADARRAAPEVERALRAAAPVHATLSDDLVGVKLMQMDLDGYRGMAAFFPFFFLSVGAFIVGSALARRVDAQRALIGTMKALGVSSAKLLGHFLAYALVLGGTGAVAGGVLGQLAAPFVTRAYADELGIPFVEWHLHLDLCTFGVLMGTAVAALAGLGVAVRVLRLNPAEAMRPPRPHLGALARLARRLPLPLPLKLALRDVLGRPLRSLGTALGVSAAVVLVLSTGVLLDAMKTTLRTLFERAQTYDVRVDFAAPAAAAASLSAAREAFGAATVEGLLAMPAALEANGRRVGVLLQSPDDDARLIRALDADGTDASPRRGALAVTRAAAKKLGVRPGDPVTVTAGGLPPLRLTVGGFADAAMGNTVTVRRADVDDAWHLSGQVTAVLVAAPGHAAQARQALGRAFPDAVRVEDAAAARQQFEQLMGLGWLMIGFMLAFGGVLAAAILFNTATLTVLERQRDLATLRALGQTMREVTALITLEHAILTAFGLAMGVPLAIGAAKAMLRAFESELFSLPFVLAPSTVAVTLSAVTAVVLLAEWPALRRVARSSLAEAVRVRES